MKISVLIPSVNGIKLLSDCINSIFNTSSGKNEIEVIIKLDFGDETINKINSLNYKENIKIIIYDKGLGYGSIHDFLNYMGMNMCKDSDWIHILNDDATILTKNWDMFLEKYNSEDLIIFHHQVVDGRRGDIGNYYFPILSNKLIQVLGRLSGTPQYDGYLLMIAKDLKIGIKLPIKYHHKKINELKPIENKNQLMQKSLLGINRDNEFKKDKKRILDYKKNK